MTTFSYTTGNPANLTGGANAAMIDIQGPFTDLRTFLNGANIDSTNLSGSAAITDGQLASPANAVWRTVFGINGAVSGLTTTQCYFNAGGFNQASGASGVPLGLWVPPAAADEAVAGKTTRLRTRVSWLTNGGAAGITLTWGLHIISASTGTSPSGLTPTLGAGAIAGTQCVVASPATGAADDIVSSGFDLSVLNTANVYLPGIVGSAGQGGTSCVVFQFSVEMRHT